MALKRNLFFHLEILRSFVPALAVTLAMKFRSETILIVDNFFIFVFF